MNTETMEMAEPARAGRLAIGDAELVVPLAEGVLVADHALGIHTANEAAADLLGWEDPSALVQAAADSAWELLETGQVSEILAAISRTGRWTGTAFLERRDGTLFEALLSACSLHSADGGLPAGTMVTIRPHVVAPFTSHPPPDSEAFDVEGLPGRFCLYYQPEFDLADGTVPSCEALLRWWHPDFGILSPGPSLARTKWAERLAGVEAWSVFAVCRQIAAWEDQGRPVQVALNVSRHHLRDPQFLPRVRQALDTTGIVPEQLAIDLPLSALVKDPVNVRHVALDLADLGVTLIVDGVSGDAPPAAFEGLPISVLKIVVGNVGHPSAIGRHRSADDAIELARTIGAISVAKSVETAADLQALLEMGFDRAFGHVFSPALAPSALVPLLDKRDGGQRAG